MKKICNILIVVILLFAVDSFGKVIRVGKDQPISTITKGIQVAKQGDTLLVSPGIYKEGNIIVEKSIAIIGEGIPVLDGAGQRKNVPRCLPMLRGK